MQTQDYDIFILAQSRWDNSYSSVAYCLAKEFSKHNRVFYIDHPHSVKDIIKQYRNGNKIKSRLPALLFGQKKYQKIAGLPDSFTVVVPKVTLSINWLNDGWLYSFLSKLNDKIVLSALAKTIKDYHVKKYIFINSFDPYYFRSFPSSIKPAINIYQTIDDITQEKYIARHGTRLEKEALVKADINFATSKELTKLMAKFTDKVYCLPNAADFTLFQQAANSPLTKPKELEGITQKVICYTGAIGSRIDFELLKKIASYHHDKLLLLVGPIDDKLYKSCGLEHFPNVRFAGQKKITALPAYLQYAHCTIIPFKYSVLTKSIYPLKINEYLTAGKPVVTTAFSEDIIDFKDVVYLSETEEDFVHNIQKAIDEDSAEKKTARFTKAKNNSWEARVNQFWNYLNNANLI
ncbi:MAG: glycosyltransferase family 1 protein [Sphingobacteriaceae bacterium]|nr:MAG: glycosyltransferase family 1 protein [Sphingobacteriaceae bacterium]